MIVDLNEREVRIICGLLDRRIKLTKTLDYGILDNEVVETSEYRALKERLVMESIHNLET